MKAKVKETGEILNVIQRQLGWYSCEHNRLYDDEELEFIDESELNRQYRRFAVAKAISAGICANPDVFEMTSVKRIAEMAVEQADALLAELDKELVVSKMETPDK